MNFYLVTNKFGSSVYENQINDLIIQDALRIGIIKNIELKWSETKFELEIISDFVKPPPVHPEHFATAIDVVKFEELKSLSPKYDFLDFCEEYRLEQLVSQAKMDPIQQLMIQMGYHNILFD